MAGAPPFPFGPSFWVLYAAVGFRRELLGPLVKVPRSHIDPVWEMVQNGAKGCPRKLGSTVYNPKYYPVYK